MPKNKLAHIAMILDGNKRWAKNNNSSLIKGYKEGFENIQKMVNICIDLKLSYLTLFTLSSENLKRNSVNNIFQVVYDDFNFFFEKIIKEKKIKIKIIGSRKNLPNKILKLIDHCQKSTINNSKLNMTLAFNYGFKDEIKEVLNKVKKNNYNLDLNNEKEISNLFYLGNTPDPDILIRTGGERRLSNFILFNLTYTEIFFTKTLWPDFDKKELLEILSEYKNINRRYGL